MKRLLILTTHLLFCALLFAQTDDPGCNKSVTGYDTGCSASNTCALSRECSSFPFHVDCGGVYKLIASTACGASNCFHCASCVSIYTDPPGANPVLAVDTRTECDDPTCYDSTGTSTAISPGDYIMYVCMIRCRDTDQEACCSAGSLCKAYGCLKWGSSGSCP